MTNILKAIGKKPEDYRIVKPWDILGVELVLESLEWLTDMKGDTVRIKALNPNTKRYVVVKSNNPPVLDVFSQVDAEKCKGLTFTFQQAGRDIWVE